MYEVEYADVRNSALSANLIAENMFTQINKEGNHHVRVNDITYHRFYEAAVNSQESFVNTSSGTKRKRQTPQGVSLCIKCCNRDRTWVALKYIKEAYLNELAEYSVADKISTDPAFALWVPHDLKNRNRIIAKVRSKYWLKTHKFRIKVPNNMK